MIQYIVFLRDKIKKFNLPVICRFLGFIILEIQEERTMQVKT